MDNMLWYYIVVLVYRVSYTLSSLTKEDEFTLYQQQDN